MGDQRRDTLVHWKWERGMWGCTGTVQMGEENVRIHWYSAIWRWECEDTLVQWKWEVGMWGYTGTVQFGDGNVRIHWYSGNGRWECEDTLVQWKWEVGMWGYTVAVQMGEGNVRIHCYSVNDRGEYQDTVGRRIKEERRKYQNGQFPRLCCHIIVRRRHLWDGNWLRIWHLKRHVCLHIFVENLMNEAQIKWSVDNYSSASLK